MRPGPSGRGKHCPGLDARSRCLSWSGLLRFRGPRGRCDVRWPEPARAVRSMSDAGARRRPRGALAGAPRRARGADPRPRRRHGHGAPGLRPDGAEDFGGPELEGCNENLCAHPARRRARRSPSATSRPAPTSSRPTPSARTPLVLAEYGLERARVRDQRGSRRALAREACAGIRRAGPAALRRRLDGADHQGDLGDRRRHLRRAAGPLPRPGARPDRGRRRLPAPRDLPGHAQRQGGAARHRARPSRRVGLARCRWPSRCTIEPTGTMLAGQDVEALAVVARSTPTCSTSASTARPARSS